MQVKVCKQPTSPMLRARVGGLTLAAPGVCSLRRSRGDRTPSAAAADSASTWASLLWGATSAGCCLVARVLLPAAVLAAEAPCAPLWDDCSFLLRGSTSSGCCLFPCVMPVPAGPVVGAPCVRLSGDCSCSLPSGELIRSSPAAAAVDGCMGAVPAKASWYQACSACSTQRLLETEGHPGHPVPGLQRLQHIELPGTEWLPAQQVAPTPSI